MGFVNSRSRDFEAARAALLRSLELEPAQPNAHGMLGEIARATGDGVDALRHDLLAIKVDPEDHEIPALVAQYLYQLGLIEEGDRFRARVHAIAPTSEIARQTELMRSINADEEDASLALARRIVEEDVGNRHGGWISAAEYLLWTETRRGNAQAVLEYFDSQVPGFSNFDAPSIPQKALAARTRALGAWRQTKSQEELMQLVGKSLRAF